MKIELWSNNAKTKIGRVKPTLTGLSSVITWQRRLFAFHMDKFGVAIYCETTLVELKENDVELVQ